MKNNKRRTTTRRNVTKSEKTVVDSIGKTVKSAVSKQLNKAFHDTDCRAQSVTINMQMEIGFKENKDGNYVVCKATSSDSHNNYDDTTTEIKGVSTEVSSSSSSSKGSEYVTPSTIFAEDPTRLDVIMDMLEEYCPYYDKQCELFDYVIFATFPNWGYGKMVENPANRKLIYKCFNKILSGKNYTKKANEHAFYLKGSDTPQNEPTEEAIKRHNEKFNNDLTNSDHSDNIESQDTPSVNISMSNRNIADKEIICPLYDLTGQKYLGNYPPIHNQFGCPYQQIIKYHPKFTIR